MTVKIALVGCGNMGYAMLKGWLAAGVLKPYEILVIEPVEILLENAIGLGIVGISDLNEITATIAPQFIVFAIKPQLIEAVVPKYQRFKIGSTYVSLAAGTSIATIERLLGENAAVVRCMPNMPVSVGEGMMVTVANQHVTAPTTASLHLLLSVSGKVAVVDDENLMDAVTAISGSGPAYLFHFIECLSDAAVGLGLPSDLAKTLALQTIYGAALMANTDGEEIQELRHRVTSPNGTTAAALSILMTEKKMAKLITDATRAAYFRSAELSVKESCTLDGCASLPELTVEVKTQ